VFLVLVSTLSSMHVVTCVQATFWQLGILPCFVVNLTSDTEEHMFS
jgi:hypothetical protein